ncbi:MAG: hypothetical protein A4E42_00331 [Methanoregulaceae archaeon PtaU1.Bin222]|nr:MAG: hypothetical protein A4E42_00331 [Methanoregulaceae archaeon PtaU1.Bin222]
MLTTAANREAFREKNQALTTTGRSWMMMRFAVLIVPSSRKFRSVTARIITRVMR